MQLFHLGKSVCFSKTEQAACLDYFSSVISECWIRSIIGLYQRNREWQSSLVRPASTAVVRVALHLSVALFEKRWSWLLRFMTYPKISEYQRVPCIWETSIILPACVCRVVNRLPGYLSAVCCCLWHSSAYKHFFHHVISNCMSYLMLANTKQRKSLN